MTHDPHALRSPREILMEAINDPNCSARDKSSIANSISRFDEIAPPEGIAVPFDPDFDSAYIFFFHTEPGAEPPDPATLGEPFIVHRTAYDAEGEPTERSIILFPLPEDVTDL